VSFDRLVEAIAQEAQARGDFDNLPGKGKPIDLSAYFDTPEELRNAYALLKNAGMPPVEIELLKEIAALKERLSATNDENRRREIHKAMQEKRLQFDIRMERGKRL